MSNTKLDFKKIWYSFRDIVAKIVVKIDDRSRVVRVKKDD